jgi:hypothetical protein
MIADLCYVQRRRQIITATRSMLAVRLEVYITYNTMRTRHLPLYSLLSNIHGFRQSK